MASAICLGEGLANAAWASVTARPFVWNRIKRGAPLYPDARTGSIRNLDERTPIDAVTAAKTRIDKALALLERKVLELKARPATAPAITDDDLFAPRASNVADLTRIAELEAASRDAAEALGRAAEAVRDVLAEQEAR
jgi:hypothetical protein